MDKPLPPVSDEDLLAFFKQLDRAYFITTEARSYAFTDQPLPIGHGQTISQPTLVVEMTRLLQLTSESRVLEIGTGSGYQTAFLAEFAGEVFTIERIPELGKPAQQRLDKLGYHNITFRIGDGSEGWPEHASFDRIIATAGALTVPQELIEQLAIGGIMIIPIGSLGEQQLLRIKKGESGEISQEILGDVRFVEFKGKYGWEQNS
ncbi:MAG: protein-L-isoaspartate(D-aspartate) O-methyltransferase [Methylocystaceae bacterium]